MDKATTQRASGNAYGDETGDLSPAWVRAGWILLLALCLVPSLNALSGGFVFDDKSLVTHHPAVSGPFNLGKLLTAPLLGDIPKTAIWRPVTTFSLAMDWRIGGGHPFWFHLANLLLYAAVCVLWVLLVRRLFRSPLLALAAGCLFAAHPLHTEAVAWISGRCDLLAALFSILALYLALDERPAVRRWTYAAVFLAVGAKESAIVVPILILYTQWAFRRTGARWPWRFGLSTFLSVAAYLILRRACMGIWLNEAPDPMDNPLVGSSLIARLPTVLDCAGRYLRLLIFPARLSIDYSAPVLQPVHGLTLNLLIGLAGAAGVVFLGFRKKNRPEGWGAGWTILTFALASNLLVVVVTLFAERLSFLPSAGLLLLLCAYGLRLLRSRPALAPILGIVLALLLAGGVARTWARNGDYHDELALYKSGVRTAPRSYKMRANLAIEYLRLGRSREALDTAHEALAIDPQGRGARDVAACALDSLGRRDEAIGFLQESLKGDPQDAGARRRLLYMLNKNGRNEEAASAAAGGMSLDPASAEWTAWAAKSAQARGDYAGAAGLWKTAAEQSPQAIDPPLNLAFCLLQSGDPRGACRAYAEAVRLAPQSAPAANGLAWTLLETAGPAQEAAHWAREAVRLAEGPTPGSAPADYYDTLARACLAANLCEEARQAAEQACRRDPANSSFRKRIEEIAAKCR